MKRHAMHRPLVLSIVLSLLAACLLPMSAPRPAAAQEGVEPAIPAAEAAPGRPEFVPKMGAAEDPGPAGSE